MTNFGQIRRVELRDVWPHEASDFTPWLAENLAALGEVLGIELELKSREAPVGDFSLDLLAHDLGRDRLVIIENQLESTDHDHLGKLLTYAAGFDAGVIVWIAKTIREEHRQAMDWLNQRTDSNTEFFGVEIEVIKIDDSRPAHVFKLIASPNEWRKTNVATTGPGARSERGEAYRSFFQDLIDRLREKHRFTNARAGQPQNWYSFTSSIRGVVYGASFAHKGRVRVDLYIDRGDSSLNKQLFDALLQLKDELESAAGVSFEWERLEDKRASRVAVYRNGSIEDDPQTLEEIKLWMIDRLLMFKKIFPSVLDRNAVANAAEVINPSDFPHISPALSLNCP